MPCAGHTFQQHTTIETTCQPALIHTACWFVVTNPPAKQPVDPSLIVLVGNHADALGSAFPEDEPRACSVSGAAVASVPAVACSSRA
jgi:hypothetical protein